MSVTRRALPGVEREKRGVVDETLRSVSNRAVWAAGDVAATDGLPRTPVAAMEGLAVARNLLEERGEAPDYEGDAYRSVHGAATGRDRAA